MDKKVYLAGPITGQSYDKADNWPKKVINELATRKIDGYSPMRGKVYLKEEYKISDSYNDDGGMVLSTINGINTRDFYDVKTCDILLANFLECNGKVSIGTVMEIAWARAMQKPIIIVRDKDNVHAHGMLDYGNIVVDSLEEGIRLIIQILLP